MEELLCIRTAPRNIVIEGHKYPLMALNNPCGCNQTIYVGIDGNLGENAFTGEIKELPIGTIFQCACCRQSYKSDGKIWLSKLYFHFPPNRVSDDNFQQVWDRTKQDIKRHVVGTQR